MQPYPPPGPAADIMAAPSPVLPRPAGPGFSRITARDAGILVLIATGIVLALLGAVSPWFQFQAVNEDDQGRTWTTVSQDSLLREQATEPESRLGLSIFILVLAAIVCAIVFLALAGWLSLRRWRANPAWVLFVGLVPMMLCLLAPVFYYQYLPEAKSEASRRYAEMYGGDYETPAGGSPQKSFSGSGEDVEYNWYPYFYYDPTFADRATWGGAAGFYLCIAAGLVFLMAYLLAAGSTWHAIKERARTGA